MNRGRFSASSLAGTSTDTSTARPSWREAPGAVGADRSCTGAARVGAVGVMDAESYSLSHPGGEDAELVAVLGNRPAGDVDPTLLQDVDDRLVGQRVLRVLALDQLLDLVLDAAGRDV